jgi:uncharacterized protein
MVFAAASLLKKHQVPFNVLCVVNRVNAKRPLDVYRFLTREFMSNSMNRRRVQFISCVEPVNFKQVAPQHWPADMLPIAGSPQAKPGVPDSIVTEWSVGPDDWGEFLCKVWDDWYRRDYGKVHVDLFESAVAQSMGLPSQRCITSEFCGKGLAVEHNRDVFSCDSIRNTNWATSPPNTSEPWFIQNGKRRSVSPSATCSPSIAGNAPI